MGYRITTQAIQSGKVIPETYVHHDVPEVTPVTIGACVQACIDNARRNGWHMAAPDTWVKVEFRQF